MSNEVTFTEFDDKAVRDFLSNMEKKLKAVKGGDRKYVGLLSSIVFRDINQHFQDEQGSQGKWKAWSPTYQEHMQRTGYAGNKILQFNGRLRQNFKPSSVRSNSEGILWFNDAVTKSGFPYAHAHNEGGSKLPKRDFMWLSESALVEIEKQTLQFMLEEGI